MANENQAPGLSTTQAGVQIVQNMVQCGCGASDYEQQSDDLFGLMSEFAIREIQANGFPQATLEIATNEANENTPMAEAYWAATSLFFRKVYQAAAAAA